MCIRDRAVKTRFGTVSVRDDDKALLFKGKPVQPAIEGNSNCLLYTSDAADDLLCVDLGGRRIIKKKKTK